jgi:LacI family gluconate utilization system Gnt-I transcriptional repressor
MVDGLQDRLAAQGYQMMLSVAKDSAAEESAVRTFIEQRVDGIVLTGIEHTAMTVAMLRAAALPVVETWSLRGPFIQMGVGFSLYDAARELTEYLVRQGYRKIGFGGFEPHHSARFLERQRGYQDAMRAAGLRDDLLAYCNDALGFSGGAVILAQLLSQEPAMDAVFCVTDVLAAGAIFECVRRGWPVPDRLAVAGYGDYEIASEITPAITTVRTPGYEMGGAAANLLTECLARNAMGSEVVNVGYTLKIRESA